MRKTWYTSKVLCLYKGVTSILFLAVAIVVAADTPSQPIPNQFPRFIVSSHEERMDLLREMFFLHYTTEVPSATLWDGWLPMSSLWVGASANTPTRYSPLKWRTALLNRRIDAEGYVSTQQHLGLAHPEGWPFPLWQQVGGIGWHFSLVGLPYGQPEFGMSPTRSTEKWEISGIHSGKIDDKIGWRLIFDKPIATVSTPSFDVNAFVSPFICLEWQVGNVGTISNPYMEWTTAEKSEFDISRRIYFSTPDEPNTMRHTIIPASKITSWTGRITRLRFGFTGEPNSSIIIKSLFTAADSRHNINNAAYLQGCDDYLKWTGDFTFLRKNIGRMRQVLHYAIQEFQIQKNKCVFTPWVGHDGRSGLELDPNGKKNIHLGCGIGNNYWDLLPFGGKDALATIYYYDAILRMAALESHIKKHPEWNIPADTTAFNPDELLTLAKDIKSHASKLFWNQKTGRFVAAIDIDDKSYDYGFTFLNCEAVYYNFATDKQAKSIVDWLCGNRTITSDTSTGKDIYHWRFAPRATTKRNLDYYTSIWNAPEILQWGQQVQDGGAVLGFSYHDLMSRLAVYGPDNAWQRLSEILDWFKEVQAAGGYRAYYSVPGRGSLQGGGTAGGLGVDMEFVESVLVPQVMLYGFMGFEPQLEGFKVCPRLPKQWPQLTITAIEYHGQRFDITAKSKTIQIVAHNGTDRPVKVLLPIGHWQVQALDGSKKMLQKPIVVNITKKDEGITMPLNTAYFVELTRCD